MTDFVTDSNFVDYDKIKNVFHPLNTESLTVEQSVSDIIDFLKVKKYIA